MSFQPPAKCAEKSAHMIPCCLFDWRRCLFMASRVRTTGLVGYRWSRHLRMNGQEWPRSSTTQSAVATPTSSPPSRSPPSWRVCQVIV